MEEVTAAQAAALTGFSERTIRRKIARGELPAQRVAPNRFAIDITDLPQRWDDRNLARRLDALDRRVRRLEDSLQALLRRLDLVDVEALADASSEGRAAEGDDIGTLQALLIELARETERLGPLIAPATSPPGRRGQTGSRLPAGGAEPSHAKSAEQT